MSSKTTATKENALSKQEIDERLSKTALARLASYRADGMIHLTPIWFDWTGKVFRLKDKGLPALQSYQRGDQLIHVNVWTPKKLTDEERRTLEKLRDMPNFKPTPDKDDKSFFERVKDVFS